jgi:hypothetical protein
MNVDGPMRMSDCWNKENHNEILKFTSSMLWRYVNKNSTDSKTEEAFLNLTALKLDDLIGLVEIRFLLSQDLVHFINRTMPGIINRLSKESLNKTDTVRNKIVGKVNWQKTSLTQTIAGNDRTLFVTNNVSNKFDLPENRLLKFTIEVINKMAKKYIIDLDLPNIWYEEITSSAKWTERVNYIYSKTQIALKNPIIKQISRISEITDKMIIATRYQRNMHYSDLANFSDAIHLAYENPFAYLINELGDKILEPLNNDDLYELAVLFKLINSIQSNGWTEEEIGLIGGKQRYVSQLCKDSITMKIYYQKLPAELRDISKYAPLMKEYGLSDRSRRPDIVIELKYKDLLMYLIVEVKRSQNQRYLADGAYKVFGYLKDYENIESNNADLGGFLIVWKGIKMVPYNKNTKINLFSWKNIDYGINEYLVYAIAKLTGKIHEEMFLI